MRYEYGEDVGEIRGPETDPVEPDDGPPAEVEKTDLVPKLTSHDETRAVFEVPAYDESKVFVPTEARVIAIPTPAPDRTAAEALQDSTVLQSIRRPVLTPLGASFEVPIPTGLKPGQVYIAKSVFGYPD